MASIFDGIDMTDPCQVWPKLEETYLQLLAGESVVRSKFGEEEVQFSAINISSLKAKIAELKAECSAMHSRRPRRHAIRAGWRSY